MLIIGYVSIYFNANKLVRACSYNTFSNKNLALFISNKTYISCLDLAYITANSLSLYSGEYIRQGGVIMAAG